MRLQPGTFLQGGRYRIIDVLGQGGFGITYLAEQVMAERKVCIKEFFPKEYYNRDANLRSISLGTQGSAEIMERYKAKFVKEAKTIAHLDHPNIIHILDVFEENNTCYYAMDYIEGESLSERVKCGGAMSERDAVAYIKQVASALEHIHEQQIMHLDVKPGNIMVRTKDDRAILIDFGLSKHYDATSGEATSTTPVGVSHGYAPMEQYQDGGVSTFSPETDIYSLGATLYFLVTGNVPPQATVAAEQGLPYLDNLSSNIRKAIEISMSYWRKDRPHTIKDFLALLDNDEPIVAVLVDDDEKTKIVTPQPKPQPRVEHPQPKTPIEPAPKQKRSRWWVWCLLLLFIVVLCISLKDLFRGSDNAKEVAKEEKRVEMPAEEVVTTPIESEQFGLNVPAEVEELVPVDTPVEEAVQTHEATPVEAPGPAEAPPTAQQPVLTEVAVPVQEPEKISTTYQIGDYYNVNGKEGVVFAVWDNGRHGKIVSLNETKLHWCTDEQYDEKIKLGLTNESDGKVNTDNVMQRRDSDQYPAFVWCRKKGADWYLPAKDELKAIYNNKSMINSTLAEYGAQLSNGWYWSSTESEYNPEFCAWPVYMGRGGILSYCKNYYYYVRAVSAF